MVCGYNSCIAALEFHHRDPTQKDFTISKIKNRSFDMKVKQELDKCDLLCSNCHKETHFTPIILGTLLDTVKPKEKPCRAPQLCCDCNVAITRHSLRCKKCHGHSTRKVARPKRDLLLEMIEKTSYVQVGRKFGVSDNTIRKWILSPQKD